MSDKDKKKKSKKSEKKKSKASDKTTAKAVKKKPAKKKAAKKASSSATEKPAAKARATKKKPAKKPTRKPAAKKTAKKPVRKKPANKPAAKSVDPAEEGPLGSNTLRVASAARAAAEAMKATAKSNPQTELRKKTSQAPAYTRQDIEMEAYLIAERDGFVNDSAHYWHLALETLKNRG